MSLYFSADSDRVNHGSATELDDNVIFSQFLWVRHETGAGTFLYLSDKETGSTNRSRLQTAAASTDLLFTMSGGGNTLQYSFSNAMPTADKWYAIGVSVDGTAGANSKVRCWAGDAINPMQEISASVTQDQTVSSRSDAAADLEVGNNPITHSDGWDGDIAVFGYWPDVFMTDYEPQRMQLWSPINPSNCAIFSVYGQRTGYEAIDWSGNGNTGVITGATNSAPPPVPIFPPTRFVMPSKYPKGTWSQIVASTPYDVAGMLLSVNAQSTGGYSSLVDIGVGSSGNEVPLIEDILVGQRDDAGVTLHQTLPLHVKEGERISMRGSTNASSQNMYPQLTLFAQSFMYEQPFARATTYGADSYNSKGTTVDPGGTANSKGSWYEITASTKHPMKALMMFLSNDQNTNTGLARQHVDIGIGAAGSEVILIPDIQISISNEHTVSPGLGPYPCNIPEGTRIAVRSQCNVNTVGLREWDCVIVGLD